MKRLLLLSFIFLFTFGIQAQKKNPLYDNFDENANIGWWFYGKDSPINQNAIDPLNNANKVLHFAKNSKGPQGIYNGVGASFKENFNLKKKSRFTVRILFPDTRKNRKIKDQTVIFKLTNGNDNFIQIKKPIKMINEWQTVTFDFKEDQTFSKGSGGTKKGLHGMIFDFAQSSGTTPADFYIDDFSYENDLVKH